MKEVLPPGVNMVETSATIKAKEMPPAERQWLASVLHVDLADDDEFTVTLRRPTIRVPTPGERASAREGLQQVFTRFDERMKDVPQAEIEEVIEEAFRHRRTQQR